MTVDATLEALADPTRRAAVELLAADPRPASPLADTLGISRPAMSRHLRVLRRAGLVDEHSPPHDARLRIYRVRPEPLRDLGGWLAEVEAFWTDQLAAFAAHAERAWEEEG